jgi:hypothetical protein
VLDASKVSGDAVANLQLGLQIELAVLPPYLYALWSLKTAADDATPATLEAARTMRAVVYEEMLHAGLVANLLNAIGGTPTVAPPEMAYPGPLPGHIATTTPGPGRVSLEPVSQPAIATFMAIEQPVWDDKTKPPPGSWGTIAAFYELVAKQLQSGKWPFRQARQLPLGDNPGPGRLVQVKDLPSAREAIETIVDQGEGHQHAPKGQPKAEAEDDDDHEVAHYDQFAAIKGYLVDGLIPTQDVWPLVKDPKASNYDKDQKAANAAFNCAYSELLDALGVQLGSPSPSIYGVPTDRMNELAHLAALLRNTGPLPKQPSLLPGPTFEYLPPSKRGSC